MLLYNSIVRLYALFIRLAALWDPKAAKWVKGRRNWQTDLRSKAAQLPQKRIWMHCASYGEFEQGRPLMDALIKKYPSHAVILSFFSPSGYEAFSNKSGAHLVCYLPLDTKRNAHQFIQILRPELAVFVKYEFWVNFLTALKKNKIPSFLVSAVFKPHHPFFKWYGGIFRRSLTAFNRLFIQDTASAHMLDAIVVKHYEISGDTRFDRVVEIKNRFTPVESISAFKAGSKLIVAGSTWPKDEELVIAAFTKIKQQGFRLLLVPHEIDDASIRSTESRLKNAGLLYEFYTSGNQNVSPEVLVLNTMGLLSKTYHYADVAYIGGGFNNGLHNTLEPSVFGNGVTFYGNTYQRYVEAAELVELGLAKTVTNSEELASAWLEYSGVLRKETSQKLAAFYEERVNVTARILVAMTSYIQ